MSTLRIVSGYYFLSGILSILAQIFLLTGVVHLKAPQEALFMRPGIPWQLLLSLSMALLMIAGAVLIFHRRKSAVMVLGFVLGLIVTKDVLQFVWNDMDRALGMPSGVSQVAALLGIATGGAVFFYALRLRQAGKLV